MSIKKAAPCYKSGHISLARHKDNEQYTHYAEKTQHFVPKKPVTLLPALLSHFLPKFLKIGLFNGEVADDSEAKPSVKPGWWFPVLGKIWLLFYLGR